MHVERLEIRIDGFAADAGPGEQAQVRVGAAD